MRSTQTLRGSARSRFAFLVMVVLIGLESRNVAQNASATTPQIQEQATATQAAARRRKFEESKRALEENGTKLSAPEADPAATLFVSPAFVGALVGDSQQFNVFDIDGKNLTPDNWSLSNSYVAELTSGPVATIVIKDHGSVTLRANVGGRYAEATITVYDKVQLPPGTIRWSVPQIPGFKPDKIVPAVPTANGPDLYTTEKNAQGDSLIRAFYSDGRQLWMRRMKGSIRGLVPH